MRIVESATKYCETKGVAKTVIFSANRFARFIADKNVSEITRADLDTLAKLAKEAGLSASTIKGTVKDIRTVAAAAGVDLDCPVVRVSAPEPEPTSAEDLDAVWPHLELAEQQHLALTFHCCFRLADILRLQHAGIDASAKSIRLTAHKTQRNHSFPVPEWLRQYLGPVALPFAVPNAWAQVIVRDRIAKACEAAKIPQIFPRNVRQAGITAWSRANGMAGAIAHGSGLSGSVLQHYVSPIQVLESAMPRVVVPAVMRGACQISVEDELLAHFRRLDAESQKTVTGVAERFVR